MVPFRLLLNHSRPTKLLQFSKCLIGPSNFHTSTSLISLHRCGCNLRCDRCFFHNPHNPITVSSSSFHNLNHHLLSKADSSQSQTDKDKIALLAKQMNMRLLNENGFLSWCRNAYLSSVVGIAMMEEATTTLGQTAGFGAFLVGGMNVFWGTSCHVTNLVRLRHATGMSGFTLTFHVLGCLLHCFLWLFILGCYIGFLDDPDRVKKGDDESRKERNF